MSTGPKYPDTEVQLSGEDGNAFSIIGRVRRALQRNEGSEVAEAFVKDAMDCGSYDELLQFVMKTVVVS